MIQFECETKYLGKKIVVKSDSFKELHQALAGIADVNMDYARLRQKASRPDAVVPHFRNTREGHSYYGCRDALSSKYQDFSEYKTEQALARGFPFYARGEKGYYDFDAQGPPPDTEQPAAHDDSPTVSDPVPASKSLANAESPATQPAPALNSATTAPTSGEMTFEPDDDLPF